MDIVKPSPYHFGAGGGKAPSLRHLHSKGSRVQHKPECKSLRPTAAVLAAVLVCVFCFALPALAWQCKPSDFKMLPLTPETAKPLRKKFEDWLHRTKHGRDTTRNSSHPRAMAWRDALQDIDIHNNTMAGMAKLNSITNKAVTYVTDYVRHDLPDYWETPVNTIVHGGDCEDIALLKAIALYHMGWPHDKMHLLLGYTRYQGKKIAHAVLLINHQNDLYVLDNLIDKPVPFSRAILQPLYMLNTEKTTLFYLPGQSQLQTVGNFNSSAGQ